MSFLAPWAFGVGVLAALAAVALHLLSTRRPPRAVLPTARFVPESEARAVSRSSKPTDLLLLACRVLAALLIGAAFARPVPDAPGPSVRTVLLLDVSASVADPAIVAREWTARMGEGDAALVFDTTVRPLDAMIAAAKRGDASAAPRAASGILSAALVAGTREARTIARGADSVRLVLISPLVEEEFDAATASARAAWPGGITLVRVVAASDTVRAPASALDTPLGDDPIAPAIARLDAARGAHQVRIVRRAPRATDSAWAREPGHVLLHWPLVSDAASRAEGVTVFGLRPATLVAPLVRVADIVDSAAGESGSDGARADAAKVIARWRDGAVAATERRVGAGCVRDIAVGIPLAGDLTLRPPFTAFLQAMVEPCGGARGLAVSDSVAAAFAGGDTAVPATLLTAASAADSTLAAWLLGGALFALAAEWLVRRRRAA